MSENNGNGNGHSATFTEAPASITMKISYRGFDDVLFTLRAGSGLELLARLDPAIDKLETMGATPNRRNGSHASVASANGSAPVCPDHNTPMKQSQKHGGWYCPKQVGEHPQTGKKLYCTHKVAA